MGRPTVSFCSDWEIPLTGIKKMGNAQRFSSNESRVFNGRFQHVPVAVKPGRNNSPEQAILSTRSTDRNAA